MKIISDPTRVGKIQATDELVDHKRFRPHACGEDPPTNVQKLHVLFQTPRVWGRFRRNPPDRVACLSDPTRVGKMYWLT